MKKIIIITIVLILAYIIKIPPYIELNDLAIIEEIAIEYKNKKYTIYLKEIIPTKNDQGIKYKYKYYQASSNTIKKTYKKLKKEHKKHFFLSKTKTLITNLNNTDNIKKELDIKPNSIIHTKQDIKSYLKN